jgi:hypothetical protein
MRNGNGFRLGVAVIALACASDSLGAQDRLMFIPVRAGEVMSPEDRDRTGVSRLTPEQRAALDVWLTRYSAEIRGAPVTPPPVPAAARGTTVFASPTSRAAATAERGSSATEPTGNDPAANASAANESDGSDDGAAQQRRRPRIDRWVPLTAPIGARVVETPDDGGYVRLADGTVWEVNLPDRPITDAWHAGDYVTVSRVAAAGDYEHVLINGADRTRAFARFVEVVRDNRRR